MKPYICIECNFHCRKWQLERTMSTTYMGVVPNCQRIALADMKFQGFIKEKKMNDKEFLAVIYERLALHGDSKNCDFMRRLRSITSAMPTGQCTEDEPQEDPVEYEQIAPFSIGGMIAAGLNLDAAREFSNVTEYSTFEGIDLSKWRQYLGELGLLTGLEKVGFIKRKEPAIGVGDWVLHKEYGQGRVTSSLPKSVDVIFVGEECVGIRYSVSRYLITKIKPPIWPR